jgi:hypothetical protein
MARTLSANFGVAVARETTLGVLPGSPVWLTLQPNSIGKIGAELSTIVRQPMSKNRMEDKGEVVDLDSGVELEADLTMDAFLAFIEAFIMASWAGPAVFTEDTIRVSAVTSTGYTVASGGALANGWLVYARGFLNAQNNGLKVLAGTSISTEIKTTGLTAESSIPVSRNVSVEVAGVQGASADITMTAGGNLSSTVLDFTTLGLTVGQMIKIGGSTAGTQFATAANNGYARVITIAANLLTLDWRTATFASDSGTGKTIQILYGQFLRNVSADHANALMNRSFSFEAAYEDLEAIGTDAYEYPAGNMANEMGISLPLTDKATMRVAFVGTDTPIPTLTRNSTAATARTPVRTAMFNTVTEFIRLSLNNVDESGISTDFKTCNLTLKNNVSGERVLGTLGAKYINFGIFEAMLDATVVFTDPDVVAAIRAHTTVAFKMGLKNADGGFFLDVPSCTLQSGKKDFPTFQSVTLQVPIKPHRDATYGYVLSLSHFPFLP